MPVDVVKLCQRNLYLGLTQQQKHLTSRNRTMRDVIGKLLKDNNMPDTPNARAIYRKMLEPDDDKTQTYIRPWVGLTDEEIWGAIARIGTSDSNINPYQILNDARAIEAALKKKNT